MYTSRQPTDPKNPPAVHIRRLGLNRINDLLTMEESCFPTDRSNRRNLRRLLRSESACCLGIYRQGELLGSAVVLFRRGTRSARVYSLAVLETARGLGLGRRLMQRAEHEARKRGCSLIRLEVRMDNSPAIRLYEQLGFEAFRILPAYYEDGAHAMRYRKEI